MPLFGQQAFCGTDMAISWTPPKPFPELQEIFTKAFRLLEYGRQGFPLPPEIVQTGLVCDGSAVEIARPSGKADQQWHFYNGYKSAHCILALNVILASGLVLCCYFDVGAHQDNFLLNAGDIPNLLRQHVPGIKALGDSLFVSSDVFKRVPKETEAVGRAPGEIHAIASVRSMVEHSFKDWKERNQLLRLV